MSFSEIEYEKYMAIASDSNYPLKPYHLSNSGVASKKNFHNYLKRL